MNKHKLLKIAIGLSLLIIALTTAIYFLLPRLMVQYPQGPSSPPADTSEFIPRDPTKSTQVTKDVKKWKRYVSDNFSFSYPPEWSVQTITNDNVLLYTPDLLEPPKGAPISVSRNSQQRYEDIITSVRSVISNVTETQIASQKLTGVELNGNINAPVVGLVQIFVSILNSDGSAIYVEYTEYPGGQDFKGVYQEIVNSIET